MKREPQNGRQRKHSRFTFINRANNIIIIIGLCCVFVWITIGVWVGGQRLCEETGYYRCHNAANTLYSSRIRPRIHWQTS